MLIHPSVMGPTHPVWLLLYGILQDPEKLKKIAGVAMNGILAAREKACEVGKEHRKKYIDDNKAS